MAQDETQPTAAAPVATTEPAEATEPAAPAAPATEAGGTQENLLQVDEALDEDYQSEAGSASYLSSLNSSVLNYKYENGRRYHAYREGSYLVPNDDEEQDRMELGHHIYRLVLGGALNLAPISESPQRVLDLGTGTGTWAMDFADEHPSAEVLGTDLSPIQSKWCPPNCMFEVDDFEAPWAYHRPFDYIHARELGGCISDEKKLFAQALEHLSPGGYFEIAATLPGEFLSDDDTAKLATDAQFWMKNICEGAAKFGKPLDSGKGWVDKMREVGFLDVRQEIRKIPIGAWAKDPKLKEIGRIQAVQELQVIDSYTPGIFSRVLGWEEAEIQVLMAKVKNDLRNPAIHLYLPVYFVWGKKP